MEEIIHKEEKENNRKLKKYQKFVKNVEYNKDGNVIKSKTEKIVITNQQEGDNGEDKKEEEN